MTKREQIASNFLIAVTQLGRAQASQTLRNNPATRLLQAPSCQLPGPDSYNYICDVIFAMDPFSLNFNPATGKATVPYSFDGSNNLQCSNCYVTSQLVFQAHISVCAYLEISTSTPCPDNQYLAVNYFNVSVSGSMAAELDIVASQMRAGTFTRFYPETMVTVPPISIPVFSMTAA